MKINYKTNKNIPFADIKEGGAFLYQSSVFMKVLRKYSLNQNVTGINAVNLATGSLEYFEDITDVEPVYAETLITRGEA